MLNDREKSIKVYKASAGSGKTYTLVYEYIRYLYVLYCEYTTELYGMLGRNLHRSILAVTFTNKATAEMKERIVKGLYDLSKGEKKDYVEKLRKDVPNVAKLSDLRVSQIALILLTDILQDYTQFRVSTIDGFFQQIVRSFARELNLNNQYKVELDSKQILEMAVDNMLSSLGDRGDKESRRLLDWITEFSNKQVEAEGSWNPRRKILDLAYLITTEGYVSQKEKFGFDLEKLNEYGKRLYCIIDSFNCDLKSWCDRAQDVLSKLDRKEFFDEKKISYFSFDHLKKNKYKPSATFLKGAETNLVCDWFKGKHKNDDGLEGIAENLRNCACGIKELCDREGVRFFEFQTAKIITSHLYILGILNAIDGHSMAICRDKDCLLISSTTEFINRVIGNSDTPFIYEKVGVATQHFMIDEFQDTSQMQWANFVPLLKETVAQGNESMIVGDVKQSIYRWRNGDWQILHRGILEKFADEVEEKPLSMNFRSGENIIEFNNRLYDSNLGEDENKRSIPLLLEEMLKKQKVLPMDEKIHPFADIYCDAKQGVGKENKPKGYVRVEYFYDDEGQTWIEQSIERMVEEMKRLGCYGEMVVLVRVKKEAQIVAEKLRLAGIPFYSSEALCVASDLAVRFIVVILEYLLQPYESLYRANFVALYREMIEDRSIDEDDFDLLAYRGTNYEEWESRLFADEEVAIRFRALKYLSLQGIVESLISLFDLYGRHEGMHIVYLQSFLDKIQKLAVDRMLDIRTLLDYWNEYGEKSFISMQDGGDAVQISTIHSSKGLEFGIVFIPFVDWSFGISTHDNVKLAKVDGKIGDGRLFEKDVSILPINTKTSQQLLNSYFHDEIVDEFLSVCLDILNVLYVATTRASQQLYMHCTEPKNGNKNELELDTISLSTLMREILFDDSDSDVYEVGNSEYIMVNDDVDSDGFVDVMLNGESKMLPSEEEVAERTKLRFTYVDEFEDESVRQKGILMHKLFEHIVTISDVEDALEVLIVDGDITIDDVKDLRREVDALLAIDGVREMFLSHLKVMNEVEIFDGEKKQIYRPDRIVIDETRRDVRVLDYKFGEYTEELNQKYMRQVARYVRLIKQMGYSAKGYILYAKERKLVEV